MCKLRLLAAASTLLGASLAAQADTVSVGNRLTNAGFGLDIFNTGDPLDNWVITSGSATRRAATASIDQDTITDVDEAETFDNTFTTGTFLVLGDTSGKIGGDNLFGPSTIVQHFRTPGQIAGRDVLSLNLNLSFDYAFDGIADSEAGSGTPPDEFTVTLQRIRARGSDPIDTLFSQSLGINNLGQISGHFEQALTLLPGFNYRLTFSLLEDDEEITGFPIQAFNSAVGLDNVRVAGTATVVPIPPSAYLFASAVAAMGFLGRRRTTAYA